MSIYLCEADTPTLTTEVAKLFKQMGQLFLARMYLTCKEHCLLTFVGGGGGGGGVFSP